MENKKWLLQLDAHSLPVKAPVVTTKLSLLFGVDAIEAIETIGNKRAQRRKMVGQELLGLGAVIRCGEHLRQRTKGRSDTRMG